MSANAQVKVNVSDDALNALVQNLRKVAAEAGHSQKEIDQMEKSLLKTGNAGKKGGQEAAEGLKKAGKEADDSQKEVDQLEKSLRKTGDTGKKAGSEIKGGWGGLDSLFQKAGAAFIAAFAVERIVAVTNALYNNALGLTQLETKATTVFGTYRTEVEAAAREVAESMGMSEKQFLASAAASADLLIPMGFNRKMATALSVDLNKLSGALSQWSGGKYDAVETSEILTKALLGEREQLKSLGISITEADVSGKLLEKGQKNLTGAALEQAKAMATLELIYAKSTDAQNAFANGTDNVVKQNAEAKAAFQDIVDILTELVTPAFHLVTTAISSALKEFKNFVEVLTTPPKDAFITDFVAKGVEEFNKLDITGQAAQINDLAKTIQEAEDKVKKVRRDLLIAGSDTENAVDIGFIRALQKDYEILDARLEGQKALFKALTERYKDANTELEKQNDVAANTIITLTTLKERLKELEEFKAKKISIFDLQGLDKANKEIIKLKEEIKFLEEFENPDRRPVPILERLGFIYDWQQTLEGKLNDLKRFIQNVDNLTKESYMRGEITQEEFETRRLGVKIEGLRKEKKFLEEAGKDTLDVQTRLLDAELALFEKNEKKKTEKLKEQQEQRKQIEQEAYDTGLLFANSLFEVSSNQREGELAALEIQKEHELKLAGDNAAAKEQIETKFAAKQQQIRLQQARADKAQALFNIAAQTAVNIIKAMAVPPPAGQILAALAAAAGAVQAGVVASQPLPAFKDGVYDLEGPGTTTSDSILARLSKGESVVPAERSQKFGFLLKPMIQEKGFTSERLRELVELHHPTEIGPTVIGSGMGGYAGLNVDEMAAKMAAPIVKAINNKEYTGFTYDKYGFSAFQKQHNSTVTLLNNRNKFKGNG